MFFVIGAAGLALLAILLKVFSSAFVGQQLPGSTATQRWSTGSSSCTFVSILTGAVGLFAC